MKRLLMPLWGLWLTSGGIILICVLLTACATTPPTQPVQSYSIDRLMVGDVVNLLFKESDAAPEPHTVQVRDDGNIVLPYLGTLSAGGKSVTELEQEIHGLLVPDYYKRLQVTILINSRTVTVSGEVRKPGSVAYRGEMSVIEAIASAGDFTDFAKKSNVIVTRTDGRIVKVNGKKARRDPHYDEPVYPGDKILVTRRWY